MNSTLKKTIVAALAMAFSLPASANYNSRYGTPVWSELPQRGMVSKNIWVGSWWSYKNNGIAYRQNATGDMKNGSGKPGAARPTTGRASTTTAIARLINSRTRLR